MQCCLLQASEHSPGSLLLASHQIKHLGLSDDCLFKSWPYLFQVSEHRLGIVSSLDANSHEIVIRPAESSRQGAAGGGPAGVEGEDEEEEEGAKTNRMNLGVVSWQVVSANFLPKVMGILARGTSSLIPAKPKGEGGGGSMQETMP